MASFGTGGVSRRARSTSCPDVNALEASGPEGNPPPLPAPIRRLTGDEANQPTTTRQTSSAEQKQDPLLKGVPEDDPDTDDELDLAVRSSMRSDGLAFAAEAALGRERTPPRAALPSMRDDVELPWCRAAAAFAAAVRGNDEEGGPSAGTGPVSSTSDVAGRAAADEATSDDGATSAEELAEVAAYRALGQCFGSGMHALCKTVANDDWGPLLSRLAPPQQPGGGGGAGVGVPSARLRDGRFRTSTTLPPPGAQGMRLYGIHPEQNCAGLVWDARQLVRSKKKRQARQASWGQE